MLDSHFRVEHFLVSYDLDLEMLIADSADSRFDLFFGQLVELVGWENVLMFQSQYLFANIIVS